MFEGLGPHAAVAGCYLQVKRGQGDFCSAVELGRRRPTVAQAQEEPKIDAIHVIATQTAATPAAVSPQAQALPDLRGEWPVSHPRGNPAGPVAAITVRAALPVNLKTTV